MENESGGLSASPPLPVMRRMTLLPKDSPGDSEESAEEIVFNQGAGQEDLDTRRILEAYRNDPQLRPWGRASAREPWTRGLLFPRRFAESSYADENWLPPRPTPPVRGPQPALEWRGVPPRSEYSRAPAVALDAPFDDVDKLNVVLRAFGAQQTHPVELAALADSREEDESLFPSAFQTERAYGRHKYGSHVWAIRALLASRGIVARWMEYSSTGGRNGGLNPGDRSAFLFVDRARFRIAVAVSGQAGGSSFFHLFISTQFGPSHHQVQTIRNIPTSAAVVFSLSPAPTGPAFAIPLLLPGSGETFFDGDDVFPPPSRAEAREIYLHWNLRSDVRDNWEAHLLKRQTRAELGGRLAGLKVASHPKLSNYNASRS